MTTTDVSVPHLNITRDVEIPMSDGGPLRANLPRDARPVPALVEDLDLFASVHVVTAGGRSACRTAHGRLRLSHRELDGNPFDVGEWRHDDPDGRATIYSGPEAGTYLLVPVVA